MRTVIALVPLLLSACAAPAPPPAPADPAVQEDRPAERTGTIAVIRPLGGAAAEVLVRDDAGGVVAVVLRDAVGFGVGDRVRLVPGALRPAP